MFVSLYSARTQSSNPTPFHPEEHSQVTNDMANNFAESCRIDSSKSIDNNSHHNFYGMRSALHHPQSLSIQTPSTRSIPNYMHRNCASSTNQPALIDNNRENNSHAKLRRQLSLNPNAFDPRLNRMQNSNLHPQPEHQMHQQQSQHRLLAPSLSSPRSQHISNPWDLHQVKSNLLTNEKQIF